jgi:hypothetical protein
MVHVHPGKFKFHYSINEHGYRGEPIPLSHIYTKRNIVVLGDSFSFGMGVKDGEEYAALLSDELGDGYDVINLATPGWGLTQQIRRYYEFGRRYDPAVVVLQYCANDPDDNFNNRVTIMEDNRFKFVDSRNSTNQIKKYLSGSIVQRSQLYNFFRGRAHSLFQRRQVGGAAHGPRATAAPLDTVSPREAFYCRLLERFADNLNEEDIPLILISVEKQLQRNPYIDELVRRLHDEGRIHYVGLGDLFAGSGSYSVEGHWGPKAHRLIAHRLADEIDPASVRR